MSLSLCPGIQIIRRPRATDDVQVRGRRLLFATIADARLRYHEVSPGFLQSDEFDPRLAKADFATKFADAEQVFRRWTVLWRSVIISALDGSQVGNEAFRWDRNVADNLARPTNPTVDISVCLTFAI
jgi:hypothetical protein